MDALEQATKVIADRINNAPNAGDFGPVELDVRTNTHHSTNDAQRHTQLVFTAKSPNIEVRHGQFEDMVRNALHTDALKPYVQFEDNSQHMKRMAAELDQFRAMEATLNAQTTGERTTAIPENYSKWFEEIEQRNEYSTKHALNVEKEHGFIDIAIATPKDADPAAIAANIEARKEAILEELAKRVIKYTPEADTEAEKTALKEKVKNLEVLVDSDGKFGSRVTIQIMTKEQLAASRDEEGHPKAIAPEKVAELAKDNPLNALKNGEKELDKDNPPHLQKALARSFLFAGEKANDIFPQIAGKDDMRRAIIKSLMKLKAAALQQQPDAPLAKAVDAFLDDDVFKDVSRWNSPASERETLKTPINFTKNGGLAGSDGAPDEKGTMRFVVSVPTDKLPEIIDQIANQKDIQPPQQATQPQPPTAPAQQEPAQAQQQPDAMTNMAQQAAQAENPDAYKNIARDIIALHKARQQQGGQSWEDRAKQQQEAAQTPASLAP
jgi:hypothetical protein